ncbi:hypothetical protein HK098_000478 [Nowakowskiella sp. JEL0407]|nr:hypothetical protein HK098_000478 [Nowakowskiella sp. JEL0407]
MAVLVLVAVLILLRVPLSKSHSLGLKCLSPSTTSPSVSTDVPPAFPQADSFSANAHATLDDCGYLYMLIKHSSNNKFFTEFSNSISPAILFARKNSNRANKKPTHPRHVEETSGKLWCCDIRVPSGSVLTKCDDDGRLESLVIRGNVLTAIVSDDITKLEKLKILVLENQDELQVIPSLENLKVLQSFEVKKTGVLEVPYGVCNKNLKSLVVIDSPIQRLNDLTFEHCSSLTFLTLKNLQISTLPKSLSNLKSLHHIGLFNLPLLKTLPNELYHLPKLKSVYLHCTAVESIGDEIWYLRLTLDTFSVKTFKGSKGVRVSEVVKELKLVSFLEIEE